MTGFLGQNLRWNDTQSRALRAYVAEGYSYSRIAALINEEFKTSYSRNAAIGHGHRIGLTNKCTVFRTAPQAYTRAPRVRAPKPPVLPVETIQMRCAEVVPHNVSLQDLAPNGCRYPYGEGPFTFCNHKQTENSSYCEAHFQLCRGAGTSSERAATKVSRLHLVGT